MVSGHDATAVRPWEVDRDSHESLCVLRQSLFYGWLGLRRTQPMMDRKGGHLRRVAVSNYGKQVSVWQGRSRRLFVFLQLAFSLLFCCGGLTTLMQANGYRLYAPPEKNLTTTATGGTAIGGCPIQLPKAMKMLSSWPPAPKEGIAKHLMKICHEVQSRLATQCVTSHCNTTEFSRPGDDRPFAIFDMDNTVVLNDVEEALMEYLEKKGVLQLNQLEPSLIVTKPVKGDTIKSYYERLCEADIMLGYAWAGQVFASLTVKKLHKYVDQIFEETRYPNRPQISTGMQELFHLLRAIGIDIYVITAAHEEIGRHVMSTSKFGYGVPADHVIGLNTLLRNPKDNSLHRSITLRSKGVDYQNFTLTSQLAAPFPWMEGKQAAILSIISEINKPVLIAGDSVLSDWYMFYHSYSKSSTLRLFVYNDDVDARNSPTLKKLRQRICSSSTLEKHLNISENAGKDWYFVYGPGLNKARSLR